jgi:hypothetical protein
MTPQERIDAALKLIDRHLDDLEARESIRPSEAMGMLIKVGDALEGLVSVEAKR